MYVESGKGLGDLEEEDAIQYLRDCLDYCKESGQLSWKKSRPLHHFSNRNSYGSWISNFGGKLAGYINKESLHRIVKVNGKQYFHKNVAYMIEAGKFLDEGNIINQINGERADTSWKNLEEIVKPITKNQKRLAARDLESYLKTYPEDVIPKKGVGVEGLTEESLQKYMHECFKYDKDSGRLTWRETRPKSHFSCQQSHSAWHTKYAGTLAGSPNFGNYLSINLNGRHYLAHRVSYLLVEGAWPAEVIDHIDGDPENNVWSNLRSVSASINQKNKRMQSNNTSGCTGVHYDKRDKLYVVTVRNPNADIPKYLRLCSHKVYEEAVEARLNWLSEQEGYTDRHGK